MPQEGFKRKLAATVVFLDKVGNHLTVGRYGPNGSLLVFAHKTAVPNSVGAENSGELAFKTLLCHGRDP